MQDISLVRWRTSHLDIQKAEVKTVSKQSGPHFFRNARSAVNGWPQKAVTWPAVSSNVVFCTVCSVDLQRK